METHLQTEERTRWTVDVRRAHDHAVPQLSGEETLSEFCCVAPVPKRSVYGAMRLSQGLALLQEQQIQHSLDGGCPSTNSRLNQEPTASAAGGDFVVIHHFGSGVHRLP